MIIRNALDCVAWLAGQVFPWLPLWSWIFSIVNFEYVHPTKVFFCRRPHRPNDALTPCPSCVFAFQDLDNIDKLFNFGQSFCFGLISFQNNQADTEDFSNLFLYQYKTFFIFLRVSSSLDNLMYPWHFALCWEYSFFVLTKTCARYPNDSLCRYLLYVNFSPFIDFVHFTTMLVYAWCTYQTFIFLTFP